MQEIRLQKVIADAGITSRRKAESLIVQGRVTVNGKKVTELGTKVSPSVDVIHVDEQIVETGSNDKVYLLLNKPRCVVTTASDPEGRPTVMDYVKDVPERIYPVGRLDYLSEGLLLMTNDGNIANLVMHPRFNVTKIYEVKVFGAVNQTILSKLSKGVHLEDGLLKPKSVRVIKQLSGKTWLEFRLTEGKNREIRRLCEAVGLTVDKLKRVAIEGVSIQGIAPGKYRAFSKSQLLRALGMNSDGTKSNKQSKFVSEKRTVNLNKIGVQPYTAADDKSFEKFRKETYYDTAKTLQEARKERILEEQKAKRKVRTTTKFQRSKTK